MSLATAQGQTLTLGICVGKSSPRWPSSGERGWGPQRVRMCVGRLPAHLWTVPPAVSMLPLSGPRASESRGRRSLITETIIYWGSGWIHQTNFTLTWARFDYEAYLSNVSLPLAVYVLNRYIYILTTWKALFWHILYFQSNIACDIIVGGISTLNTNKQTTGKGPLNLE